MLQQLMDSLMQIASETQTNIPVLGRLLGLIWGMYILNLCLGQRLLLLGLQPRKLAGLPGILCAPFLHANFNHIFFNTIPLAVLANFILIQGLAYFIGVSLFITLLSGSLTWCFAKKGLHIGASGVITGYWGFLVANIYQQGTLTAIVLGIVCLYYFAGIFFAIFPGTKGVSWQGHLFGLLSGLLLSYSLPLQPVF